MAYREYVIVIDSNIKTEKRGEYWVAEFKELGLLCFGDSERLAEDRLRHAFEFLLLHSTLFSEPIQLQSLLDYLTKRGVSFRYMPANQFERRAQPMDVPVRVLVGAV